MGQEVDVRAIHALDELRGTLVQFRERAEAALREMEAAIHRVQQHLSEREAYWKRQVARREAEHKKALAALAACRSQAYRDPKTGRTYVPPCTQEQAWVMRTRVELERAAAALRAVREWRKLVERAANDYRRQARRLTSRLEADVSKATAQLKRQVEILHSYVADISSFTPIESGSFSGGKPPSSSVDEASSTPGLPSQTGADGHQSMPGGLEKESGVESLESGPGGIERGG